MSTSRTTTINFTSTSLRGITGAPTPATFTATGINANFTVAAVLTEPSTTITGFQVPGTTGLAVVDGTTLTWRHQGITLANGDVVSLGFNGLEDQTTTAEYGPVTVSTSTRVATTQTRSTTKTKGTHHTSKGGSPTSGGSGATGTGSAPSSSSSGIAPTLGAGKAVALLGALGGVVAYGL